MAQKDMMYLLFTFALAHAHGPPLAPTGIAVSNTPEDAPLALLTEGIAQRTDDPSEWRFLCPALWSGLPDAPLVSKTQSGVLVHGLTDAFLMRNDGTSSPMSQPEIGALRVIDTAGQGSAAVGLVREETQDALWRIDPPTRIQPLPGRTTSLIVHRDTLLVTSLDGEGNVLLLTLNPKDGAEIARNVWPIASSEIPEGRSDGQHAWLVRKTEDAERIERWGDAPKRSMAKSEGVISGPITTNEQVYVGLGQTLHRLVDGTWTAIDEAVAVDCLASADEQLLVCSGDRLLNVDALGQEVDVFFDAQTLLPPALERMPADLASDCEVEWYRALSDLGRSPDDSPLADTGREPSSEGCDGCSNADGASLTPALLLLFVGRARRRKR